MWCSTKWAKKPQNGSQGMHYSCSFSHFLTASYVLWHLGWHRLLSFDSVQSCHIHLRVCHFSCWEWASFHVCMIYTEQTQYVIVFCILISLLGLYQRTWFIMATVLLLRLLLRVLDSHLQRNWLRSRTDKVSQQLCKTDL